LPRIRRRTHRSVRQQRIPRSRPFSFNDIEDTHYGAWLLGHAKLDTTALYTRVATKTIREIMSPLDHITRTLKEAEPPA
jgi:hypothetical protein